MKRKLFICLMVVVMAFAATSGTAFAKSTYYKTRTFVKDCVSSSTNIKHVQCKSYVSSVTKTQGGSWFSATRVSKKSKAVRIKIKGDNLSGHKLTGKAVAYDNKGNKYNITITVLAN